MNDRLGSEDLENEFARLDYLIDTYIAYERGYRPRLWYPPWDSTCRQARTSRQYDDEHESNDSRQYRDNMRAMTGAWSSLNSREDRIIRADAMNRECRMTIFRLVDGPLQESDVILVKVKLQKMLASRGIMV